LPLDRRGELTFVRVALIAPPWAQVPPPSYGGTEAVVDRLARGMQNAGHDVLLFTTGDSTCPVPKASVYRRAHTHALGSAVVELRHLLHAYREVGDYDIVHDHTIIGPIYAERHPGLRVVTTNHGPFNDDLCDLYESVADRVPIIAISQHQASTAGKVPIAKVIHHGVDPEAFPVGPGDGGYLTFVGRMAPSKGVREAALVARQAGVPLLIAAKMWEHHEREYFEEMVQPLLGNGVEYVGEVTERERAELVGHSIGLVNPLDWPEPFGLVMVESLAYGTPVLTFPAGAAPEIVEDGVTGFVCRDVADMVAAVGRIPALDRAACRRAVEQHFSTERMVREHLELFERVLAG
jgi:glycosyltransferase involved in cell wall biosynthesis